MQVYIVSNLTKDIGATVALRSAAILRAQQVVVLFSREILPFLTESAEEGIIIDTPEACYKMADVIVTIGGDGTILHEAVHSLAYNKPILGVNLGRCGFLATCEEEELQEKLTKLASGETNLDTRILLQATIQNEQESSSVHSESVAGLALNDVVISKGHTQQAIDLSVYCDEILVESYRCDGVIVATPTGSTAYSLAAGGPIVDSQTMGIVLTAICPHKLRAPSMVFAPNRVLRVVVGAASRGEVLLSCDGQKGVPLQENESVEITVAPQRVQLVGFSNAEQFEAIDRKLKSKD